MPRASRRQIALDTLAAIEQAAQSLGPRGHQLAADMHQVAAEAHTWTTPELEGLASPARALLRALSRPLLTRDQQLKTLAQLYGPDAN